MPVQRYGNRVEKIMKRMLSGLLALILLLAAFAAAAETSEDVLEPFVLRHGDRNVPKIAITVDDCYQSATEWIQRDVDLCNQYGIAMTFFPLVYTGCLEEKYRDLWQGVLDSGCEIGTHSNRHVKFGNRDVMGIVGGLGRAQEALDKTLGYHYEVRWLRPPYGSIAKGSHIGQEQVKKAIQKYGFDHIVSWDVSETVDLKKALKNTQNGSILLFHSKKKDTLFLEKLIPELLAQGYQLVTVSELFGFDPPETSEELYVYDKANYQ